MKIFRLYRLAFWLSILFAVFWLSLRFPLFDDPLSTVLRSSDGHLLGASIAVDGQWRFGAEEEIPVSFRGALLTFEDQRFYSHPGFDIRAIARAMRQNIRARRIVSGGSTLSMQLIRLSRKGKARTWGEKLIEVILAARMEMSLGKDEILRLYAANAPFGGNVVGLSAASWRYYEKDPRFLSPSESASLAVLPNSPALVRPGVNTSLFKQKRDRLLQQLVEKGLLQEEDYRLAVEEALPARPNPLPREAPHLLHYLKSKYGISGSCISAIDFSYQHRINEILKNHYPDLEGNGVHNAAVLLVELKTGRVLAYAGNIPGIAKEYSPEVDLIQAERSTGSILKPLLYYDLLQKGAITPSMLIKDIPSYFGNFHPHNYTDKYLGAVPASDAIALSLNVPSVWMLKRAGVAVFYDFLKSMGMQSLRNAPGHYGLSLILGGAEVTLWQLASMYGKLSAALLLPAGNMEKGGFALQLLPEKKELTHQDFALDPASVFETFRMMSRVRRPSGERAWSHFSSGRQIAWKTGTSYGGRDAWSIGLTPRFGVFVWSGNASGEGRSAVSGLQTAAPVLFDVFNILPNTGWFEKPESRYYAEISLCPASGMRAGPDCPEVISRDLPPSCRKAPRCAFHRRIYLDEDGKRAFMDCYTDTLIDTVWFILPPGVAWYYGKWHSDYKSMPALSSACDGRRGAPTFRIIYPLNNSRIRISPQSGGGDAAFVAEAAAIPNTKLYWHLDRKFLGVTVDDHRLSIKAKSGRHMLTVENARGERNALNFELLSSE